MLMLTLIGLCCCRHKIEEGGGSGGDNIIYGWSLSISFVEYFNSRINGNPLYFVDDIREGSPQLLPRCMEVHCLQCKNCQYRYLWQYPSEMSNFFFLTSIYQTGWLPKQFIIVGSPDYLVLIPGGFNYCRDARSTMVHHYQRADFKEPSGNSCALLFGQT